MSGIYHSQRTLAVLVAAGILTGSIGCGDAGADPRGRRVAAEATAGDMISSRGSAIAPLAPRNIVRREIPFLVIRRLL